MDTRSRKRGVKASRAKLETAMIEAGFKTQAALAYQIEKNESLSSPPKDTVNRAFRQEYVSPNTIARIAKALNVEPYTLYMSQKESDQLSQHESEANPTSEEDSIASDTIVLRKSSASKNLLFAIPVIILLVASWFIFTNNQIGDDKPPKQTISSSPPLGKYSLVIYPDSLFVEPIADLIKQVNQNQFNSTVVSQVLIDEKMMDNNLISGEIARKFQSDGVITIRSKDYDRYIGIQFYLYLNGGENLIWTASPSKVELNEQIEYIVNRFNEFLKKGMGLNHSDKLTQPTFETIDAQEKYLKARNLLDNQQKELNLKRAQSSLSLALKNSPGFAKAHAALCESFLYESWIGDEKSLLEQAQSSCSTATELSPQDTYSQSTLAYLFRRSGRIDQSIESYRNILVTWPNNLDALSGLASVYLELYRQQISEYPDAKQQALNYALKAAKAEPSYWKHHFNLGIMYYYNGEIENAIKANENAVAINPNSLAYTNLGTMNFCLGNLDKSLKAFSESKNLNPDSYLGDEYLGMVHYYLGDFRKSAELRKQALDSFGDTAGVHQMWGALGDSLRRAGSIEESISAYIKAIEVIDRDTLRGNAAASDKAFLYYYKIILSQISHQHSFNAETKELEKELSQLSQSDMETSAYVRLAQIRLIQGKVEEFQRLADIATGRCPVYSSHPDFKKQL